MAERMVDAAYQHIAEEITGNVYLGVQILNRKGGERVRLQIRVDEKYGSSFTSSYCSETARRRIDLNNGCDVLRKPEREREREREGIIITMCIQYHWENSENNSSVMKPSFISH